jgi:Domain of unknown function (DUF4476)
MKKFFTLLLSSLFSLSLLAYDGSRLSISTVSNTMDLKIEIDGRRINMQDNTITLSNITEGSHSVRIYREKKRSGTGFNFGKKPEIIYASSVFVKRGFHTDITVNRFGKVFIDERRMDSRDGWYDEDENYGDYEDETGGDWNNGYGNVMSTRDFEMVKEQIRKEWFEKNRLVSAKVIMDKNNFTVQQVKEFMLLFTFEENKLEVAKYAYRKTVDKQNYYQLNDALTFKSSKDDLARFIRESR